MFSNANYNLIIKLFFLILTDESTSWQKCHAFLVALLFILFERIANVSPLTVDKSPKFLDRTKGKVKLNNTEGTCHIVMT